MSHFSVAVISDGTKGVEELLAPYQENNCGTCPKKYLKFYNRRDTEKEKYETGTIEKVELPDGSRYWTWDDILYKQVTKEQYEECKKDKTKYWKSKGYGDKEKFYVRDLKALHAKIVVLSFKELYPTIEEYLEDFCGYEYDEEGGDYGYWENPNAKWDYYSIGGRWNGILNIKSETNNAYIRDVDLSPDPEIYKKSIRFWEVAIDGDDLKPGEQENDFNTYYRKEFYIDRYLNKETYAKIQSSFNTFAVITSDGVWHEKGEMGWWGFSSETPEESLDWDLNYKKRFIDTVDPDWTITIVDCHI